MLRDTSIELAKIAAFVNQSAGTERLAEVVERSSAEQMRKLEKDQALLWSSTQGTRQDVPFVREARSGGWKTSLPESAVAEFENAWAPLMKWLGYELSDPGLGKREAQLPESLLGVPTL
jgi:hypothetical protein